MYEFIDSCRDSDAKYAYPVKKMCLWSQVSASGFFAWRKRPQNATLVTELIVDLRERGLDVTRPVLAVLDASKALRRAVLDVFDAPVLARCQLHKIRNVRDKLPQRLRPTVERKIRAAYHAESALEAQAQLTALARELDRTHPSAAASLREGLPETLTVLRLGGAADAGPDPAVDERDREHDLDSPGARGQRQALRDGQMALRWCAAGMIEAGKQFRRVNGHLQLPTLRAALEREVIRHVGPVVQDDLVNVA